MIHLIVYCALTESVNRIKKLFLIKFRDIKINLKIKRDRTYFLNFILKSYYFTW